MRVAIAQLDYTIGDFDGNKAKIVRSIRQAKAEGAQLVIFAEQAISGRPAYDLLNDPVFLEQCQMTLEAIAEQSAGISVIVGLPLAVDNATISAAAIIKEGKVIKYIGKRHVMSRDETLHLGNSKGFEIVRIGDMNIAVVIGSDIHIHNLDFGSDTDLIVSLKSTAYSRGVVAKRHDFYAKMAYRKHAKLIVVNHIGGQTDIVYDGWSAVFNDRGECISLLKGFEEDFTTVDLGADLPAIVLPEQDKDENVYRAIRVGLKDFFVKNGFSKAVVGISGGIDSAVTCALAVEVLGRENVRGLIMPSKYSSNHSVEDSVELAQNLGIRHDIINITDTYTSLREAITPLFEGKPFDATEENMQARIHGAMLMALSNKLGYIVLNTNNKSESAVGYTTLYGDTVGSFCILGDLYKTEVYSLARYINRRNRVIPENTLTKAPSAELRPEQKDTDSLPEYELLDAILYRLIEENQSVDEIATAGFDYDTVKKVYTLFIKNGYKRYQTPPVLRLSTVTLGKGKILPLTYDFSCLL
ncbi:MAG: NAD+ synthase [Rikenellaceae bacterium]|jgi:NAD+ synthase (glutamine-hydrolysing)|nr:NAD+ synthase [Rikenellaceae bacterium]